MHGIYIRVLFVATVFHKIKVPVNAFFCVDRTIGISSMVHMQFDVYVCDTTSHDLAMHTAGLTRILAVFYFLRFLSAPLSLGMQALVPLSVDHITKERSIQ